MSLAPEWRNVRCLPRTGSCVILHLPKKPSRDTKVAFPARRSLPVAYPFCRRALDIERVVGDLESEPHWNT